MLNPRQKDGIALGALIIGIVVIAAVVVACLLLAAALAYIFGAGLSSM